MLKNFAQLHGRIAGGEPRTVCVAAAEDPAVIQAVGTLYQSKGIRSILVGNGEQIRALCAEAGLDETQVEILPSGEEGEAMRLATEQIRRGRADVLMKGLVNSSVFLRAVLQGLDHGPQLSHLAAFEIPGWDRLQFHTDGGMCVAPDLTQKAQIVENAVEALHRLGYDCPKVAALAANERVDPKIPATTDGAALQKMNEEGLLAGCLLEGPVALDVALSAQAAAHKHIESNIAGQTDLFLMPAIEAGNLVGKTLMYLARAKMAGVVLGACCPVVMVSRGDDGEAKVNSVALACAVARGRQP